ncbi:MAG: class I adenylate-forming enzyme family protein [Bdellovibrionota bacterium]
MDGFTIQNWLTRNAKYRPKYLAFVFKDTRWTYEKLNQEVNRLVHAFQAAGIGKGDKVATCLPHALELFETYWACAKLGAVAVPLSPLLRKTGLTNLITNSDTKLLITNADVAKHLEEVKRDIPLDDEQIWLIDSPENSYHAKKSAQSVDEPRVERVVGSDPYNIIYSSGTTGEPKGIVISHEVRALYGSLFANTFRMTPESVSLHSGSIIFNGAFLTLMPSMLLGATYILEDSFKPREIVGRLKQEKITHTILVPSQISACLQEPEFSHSEIPSLEYILSVGAPLLKEYKEELNRRMPEVFYELYGLTEGFMTILDKTQAAGKAGSVGCPPPFMDLKICNDKGEDVARGEVGEIVGRGPILMSGYYNRPELTAETIRDGWLYSGDLGFVDEDGFLTLAGRKKDLIISGGVNVYPTDIEAIIAKHPKVKDVSVFGVPHCDWGEAPVAAVVLANESGACCPEEMRDWVSSRIEARYQKVDKVWFVPELPRNVAGKVLKRELRETYLARN